MPGKPRASAPTVKRLKLRRADRCVQCEVDLVAGESALWDSDERQVTCLSCADGTVPTIVGVAGASAEAKGRRLRQSQIDFRQRRKEEHPILGRVFDVIEGPPTAGSSWLTGSVGEQMLGAALDNLGDTGVRLLHDRQIPRSKANIDHIAIAASGVWVIDAKRYDGLVQWVDKGGWFRTDIRLTVAGRDRTKLTDGVLNQVDHVRKALESSEFESVPVQGALCFVDSSWRRFSKPFYVRGVFVTWGKALYERITTPGELTPETRNAIHALLGKAFRPAR